MHKINFESLLEGYRHRGYTLNNRVSPQPTQRNSYEEQIASALCPSCQKLFGIPKHLTPS